MSTAAIHARSRRHSGPRATSCYMLRCSHSKSSSCGEVIHPPTPGPLLLGHFSQKPSPETLLETEAGYADAIVSLKSAPVSPATALDSRSRRRVVVFVKRCAVLCRHFLHVRQTTQHARIEAAVRKNFMQPRPLTARASHLHHAHHHGSSTCTHGNEEEICCPVVRRICACSATVVIDNDMIQHR